MIKDNILLLPELYNIKMNNGDRTKNYDFTKKSFLAPTPSYKHEYSMNQQIKPETKDIYVDYAKGANSSQYHDLLHNPNTSLYNQQSHSFFGVPSPAYGPFNNNTINYYNMSSVSFDQQRNEKIIDQSNNDIRILNDSNDKGVINPPSSFGIVSDISEDIKPVLQNIVSTANLKCQLDLRKIALHAKNAEYNPKRFAAVIMRIKEPKTTALIFASGKMVCTGARSEQDSKKAARQYAKIIQKLGYEVRFSEFKIQNIVGSCDVKFQISLEGLSTSNKFCSYEPEIFPGLIFKMISPKIVLLIFVSGKIVLTGAKNRQEIFDAFQIIYPLLLKYKKISNTIKTVDDSIDKNDDV